MKVALLLLTLFVTIPNQVMSRLSTFLDLPTTAKHHPAFDQHMNRAELQLQREQQSQERLERTREQRERAREKIATATPNDDSQLVRLTTAEVDRYSKQDQPWLRRVSSSGSNWHLASPGTTYEPWQQAYRTLGAFIDCDHSKSSYQNRHNFNYNVNSNGCSRWMMWASYVDPNYHGKGYNEYHGDNPVGVLDCHDPNSDWKLLGVYRQEFYQYIEQISKHLWAISDYNYVVALAGLAYMTDADCFYVGTTSDSKTIWAGVNPIPVGNFEIALYTDDYCLVPNTTLGMTFDSFMLQTSMGNVGSNNNNDNNNGGDTNSYSTWWYDSQEYSLKLLNEVYDSFKYCTSCMDYPTYQDGYFIGDYGTDEDDLINQCWKFYSHNSYSCESDCISRGNAQGGIVKINYNGQVFGQGLSSSSSKSFKFSEGRASRTAANIFVSLSAFLFALMVAFAIFAKRHNDRLLQGKLLDKAAMKRQLFRLRSRRRKKEMSENTEATTTLEPQRSSKKKWRPRRNSSTVRDEVSGSKRSSGKVPWMQRLRSSRDPEKEGKESTGNEYVPPVADQEEETNQRRPLD